MTPPRPTSDKHTWKILFESALRIIDSLEENGYGKLDFRLGGGTVLMFRFDHRVSKDIDIFTHDAQALSYLSPRLNVVAEREAQDYEEQPNAVKLLLPDGDIDFIVAGPVIRDAPRACMTIAGRMIELDATAEILAKKLLYRADVFKARDVFDMCVALTLDEPAAIAALRATTRTRPALLRRLSQMAAASHDELVRDLLPTQAGGRHTTGMVDRLVKAITAVDATPLGGHAAGTEM